MVDLAKIRKKAKDKKAADAAAAGSDSKRTAEPVSLPGAVALVDEQPQPGERIAAGSLETESGQSRLDRFKATAGQIYRFPTQVSRGTAAGDDLGVFELLTFVIASERYALEIEKIVEIILPRNPTRVPNTDPTILGIISLRGTIVTLLDVRKRLGHPVGVVDPNHSRIIVIDQEGEIAGFLVDRVTRVVKVSKGDVETHPVVHQQEQTASIRGVFQQEGQLTILLDLEALIR